MERGVELAGRDASQVVIFYSTGDAWRVGHLLAEAPADDGRLRVVDAENRQVYTVRGWEDVHRMTAPLPAPEECTDLVMLPDVAEGPLLCALRVRYNDGRYYTALGRDQLLFVNPCKAAAQKDLPSPSLFLQNYPNLPLHPWAIGARALQHVQETGRDVVVMCSGDPGSGKTSVAELLPDALLHDMWEAERERSQRGVLRITAQSEEAVSRRQLRACVAEGLGMSDEHVVIGDSTIVPQDSDPALMDQGGMTTFDVPVQFTCGSAADREAWVRSLPALLPQLEYRLHAPRVACPSGPDTQPLKSGGVIAAAFCNARTTRNVNASRATVLSRFAVRDGTVIGTELRPFLLECARAAAPPHGERTFHIFYYIVAGVPGWDRDRYHLPPIEDLSPDTFTLLGKPRSGEAAGGMRDSWAASRSSVGILGGTGEWVNEIDELAAKYQKLVEAFEACGVTPQLQDWAFRTLAAVLHLGQVEFPIRDTPSLRSAASLLQVTPDSLAGSLTKHNQTVRGEPVSIALTPAQSASARDALIRSLYQKVVDIVVATVNVNLAPKEEVTGWVSVLDTMGTANTAHNDLSALAVNYCNDVLQNYCNSVVFDDGVAECVEELGGACQARVVEYDDAYATVKLLRANQGVFAAIDDESTQQMPSETRLLEHLDATLKHHPKFDRKATSPMAFCIAHAGGEVEYGVGGMVAMNRNAVLPHDIKRCLSASLCDYTSHAFLTAQEVQQRQQYEARSSGEMPPEFVDIHRSIYLMRVPPKPTHLATVKQQVQALMGLLEGARPFFIRCVRPAKALSTSTSVFHGRYVLKQLRSLGVLNTVRQRLANFVVQETYAVFLQSLGVLARGRFGDPEQQVQMICEEQGLIPDEDYQLGRTKVFVKKDGLETLLEAQESRDAEELAVIQAQVMQYLALRQTQQLQGEVLEAMRDRVHQERANMRKETWKQQRGQREDVARQAVMHDEVRGRRNVDNQEAVDYISIMTGLIEGVELIRTEQARLDEEAEREQHLRLKSLLREERMLEERCAKDRISQRMLVQGGRLDRVLAKKYGETQRMRERKAKTETTQQRMLRNRIESERHRLKLEQRITEKENDHEHFVEQKKMERAVAERQKIEIEEMDRQAREARMRARQAWEEAKREEYDLDIIEREVVVRIENELMDEKKRESFRDKRQRMEEMREGQRRIAQLEKLRAQKQLAREKKEKEAERRVTEEKRKREQAAWREQQNQRVLKQELDKIRDEQERRRFARRQQEKKELAAPKVYQQIASSLASSHGSIARGQSPGMRSSRSMTPGREPPSYGTQAPTAFQPIKGNTLHGKQIGTDKRVALHRFASRTASEHRAASASPARAPPRSPQLTPGRGSALRVR